jgi:hypothetical protein
MAPTLLGCLPRPISRWGKVADLTLVLKKRGGERCLSPPLSGFSYGSEVVVHSPALQSGQLTGAQARAPAGHSPPAGGMGPPRAGVAAVTEIRSLKVNRPSVNPLLAASKVVG